MPSTKDNLNNTQYSVVQQYKSIRKCYVLSMCKTTVQKIHFSAEHKYLCIYYGILIRSHGSVGKDGKNDKF